MHFDERRIGDYRVYAGALEGPLGDGYIAALVVTREQNLSPGSPRELMRDESLACGHRFVSPAAALSYAMSKAQEIIRRQNPLAVC